MKKWKAFVAGLMTLIMALLPLVSAVMVHEECINSTHKRGVAFFDISNTDYNFTEVVECNDGCSDTLNDCRPDMFAQIGLYVLGMIVTVGFSAFALWVSHKTDTAIDGPLLIIIALMVVFVATFDVFNSVYFKTIIIFSAAVPLMMLWYSRREQEEDDEYYIESEAE